MFNIIGMSVLITLLTLTLLQLGGLCNLCLSPQARARVWKAVVMALVVLVIIQTYLIFLAWRMLP
ncbi:MAG TPA: hypothetical protein VGP13_03935 [Candidatus Paceibacterota bacterium]|jgi:hypothetical protein|nr:hypothetical protein [Candidatus Paceibacterota bacterium]